MSVLCFMCYMSYEGNDMIINFHSVTMKNTAKIMELDKFEMK